MKSHISFSNCLRIKSFECAVTFSVLLQTISKGILFFTTLALVRISYKYLETKKISSQTLCKKRKGGEAKKQNRNSNYSAAARQLGKNSKESTTKTTPAAWGMYSSSLGRRRECPGTSTRCTGLILPFCPCKKKQNS